MNDTLRIKNRLLVVYVLLHLAVTVSFMLTFLNRFALPVNTLSLHLLLLVTWHLSMVLILIIFKGRSLAGLLVTMLMGAYLCYLPLLYGLNWFAHLNWGSNVMFDFIQHLPDQVRSIAQTEGIPLWLVMLVCALWLLLGFWLARRLVLAAIDQLHQARQQMVARRVWSMVLIVVFVVLFIGFTYDRRHPRDWIFEPLLSSWAINNNEYRNSNSIRQALRDQQIREDLEQNLTGFQARKNVILIIADALRADRMSVYGHSRETTPYLSARSEGEDYQQVETFLSTCSESICGIYSILSSREYRNIGFDLLDLAGVLSAAGYSRHYILSSNHNYNALNELYGAGIEQYTDGNGFPEPLTLHDDAGVLEVLRETPAFSGQPAMFYVHLMSSHSLGKNQAEFEHFQPAVEHLMSWVGKTIDEDISDDLMRLRNGYDNGVVQTDHYIQQILQLLDHKGYLEDAVVIITGDHGDGLGENGYVSHTYHLQQEDIRVPLIWMDDDCRLQNHRFGTHIDVAPTVLDCLGLPIPDTWQGRSLMSPYEENRITFHQTIRTEKTIMAVLENQRHLYKLMADLKQGETSNFRLFDAYQDPTEERNLYGTIQSPDLQLLIKAFNAYYGLAAGQAAGSGPD